MEKSNINTFVYTLGNGWWPWQDIPQKYRSPSILRCAWPMRPDVFLPQLLFDGSLEKSFYDFKNWEVTAIPAKDNRQMLKVNVAMPGIGIQYVDVLQDASLFKDISIKERIDFQFDFFNKWKKNQIFVLDVRRMNGFIVANRQLLDFESYLMAEGFDLRNFIYVANDISAPAELFDDCKAKAFMYSKL